jgi:hypothetical protein
LPLEYMPFTCSVTLHLIIPAEDGVDAMAARPVVVGWLFQFTTDSVQLPASCNAGMVRPALGDALYSRSSALATWHPVGIVAMTKRTRLRVLSPVLEFTPSTESVPLFLTGIFW